MGLIIKNISHLEELRELIVEGHPMLFTGSQTSTVIPFEKLEGIQSLIGEGQDLTLVNLNSLPPQMSMHGDHLVVSGYVSWKEAKAFCRQHGREIMCSPTEELASILSGLATSATGERSFGHGSLRSQVVRVKYMDDDGELIELSSEKKLNRFEEYHVMYSPYKHFKNAPFPRLDVETDLMVGTEGQLGVIVEAEIKTVAYAPSTYLFFKLPKWELDFAPHLELFDLSQKFRGRIISCELIDENSLSYLPAEERPFSGHDLVFLEIRQNDFESFYQDFVTQLKLIHEEAVFEIDATKCQQLRVAVPRAIFEVNSRMGVTKKGTDVQVAPETFQKLLEYYRMMAKGDVAYNMFGHFGDAHLHFNYMPSKEKEVACNEKLEKLYGEIKKWQGSPFAEHGIGMIKKKFIAPFYTDIQKEVFRTLKNEMDPHRKFFPQGFMNV